MSEALEERGSAAQDKIYDLVAVEHRKTMVREYATMFVLRRRSDEAW